MKKYELMAIVSGQLPEDLAKDICGKVKKTVESLKGIVSVDDFWGRRKLAYKIQGQDHGYYNVLIFTISPDKVSDLETEIRLITEVIRFMVVVKEEDKQEKRESKPKKEISDKPKKPASVVGGDSSEENKEEVEVPSSQEENKVEKEASVDQENSAKKPKVSKKVTKENDKDRLEELDKKIDEILND